jgi:hypothetical protein
MGTVLHAIFAVCIPITTAACGADDEVLARCVVVNPMHLREHRSAISAGSEPEPRDLPASRQRAAAGRRSSPQVARFEAHVEATLVVVG